MYVKILPVLLSLISVAATAQPDTSSCFFATGSAVLSSKEKSHIDDLLYKEKLQHGSVTIIAYADEPGGTDLNQKLSQARAEAVKQYLVQGGVSAEKIVLCEGRGSGDRHGTNLYWRRADIITDTAGEKLLQLKVNETMQLDELSFIQGTARIRSSSLGTLEKLATTLKKFPAIKIRLEGHVCCLTLNGQKRYVDDPFSIELSVARARAVYSYLVETGIDSNRLSYVGFGATHPKVYPATTLEEMQANRRVEVRVTGR